jgi:hypothetical protein
MQTKNGRLVQSVLFSNGVVDLLAALALFFPVLDLPLPGYLAYTGELAFIAGGWGIAALNFGIGRIWASYKPEFYRVMVTLGVVEGTVLTAFCLINVFFLGISLLQAALPLAVGSVYGVLSLVALLTLLRLDRHG